MKTPANTHDLLYNMLAAIDRIEGHAKSAGSPACAEDGIIFNLIIIGEAASKLPEKFRSDNLHIPWQDIIGMRNRLVYAYFIIDPRTVWDTVHNHLPNLKKQLLKLLKD